MKRALVLCGGGSKGAYHMGAWDALRQLDEKFDIVTGTSIGSLVGALYVQDDYEKCSDLWKTISNSMLMNNPVILEGNSIKIDLKKNTDLLPFIKKYIKDLGADIGPFLNLMDDYIDPIKIKKSKIDLGIVTAIFPSFKPVEVVAKELPDNEISKFLVASSSCFPIFPLCKIGNNNYIDGGYYDNLPINFAINMGAIEIVAIDLNYNYTHKEFLNYPFVKYIKPSWHLGSFFLFDQTIIQNNRILGYNDTMKAYNVFDGYRYTFFKYNPDLQKCREFNIYLTKMALKLRNLKIKTHVKPEENGDIFFLLRQYTNHSLSDYDYFIRTIEILGEFFSINHLLIYNVSDFIKMIISEIDAIEYNLLLLKDYDKLKSGNKQRDFIARINDKLLMKYVYNTALEDDFVCNLLATKPIIFLMLAFYQIWNKKMDLNYGKEI